MVIAFYVAGAIALFAAVMVITNRRVVQALLYLVVSLLAAAVMFYILGAPFVAALEVIIYAGAIMVLFVFTVMLLKLGEFAAEQEKGWIRRRMWVGPTVLAAILAGLLIQLLVREPPAPSAVRMIPPQEVGIALFSPYVIGVEIAAFLLLAGLVGAFHLGRRLLRDEGAP